MDALQGYGSGSEEESQPVASTSQTTTAKRPRSPISSDEDEEDKAAAADAFGLNNINAVTTTHEPIAGGSRQPQTSSRPPLPASGPDSTQASTSQSVAIRSAPDVVLEDPMTHSTLLTRPNDTTMHVNIPYSDLTQPAVGPSNPFSTRKLGALQNSVNGHFEGTAMSDYDFRTQQRTFDTLGYARNPSMYSDGSSIGGQYVGDVARARQMNGASALESRPGGSSSQQKLVSKAAKKQRIGQDGELDIVEGEGAYVGPWGGWAGEKTNLDGGAGPSEEEIKRAEELSTSRQREKQEMEAKRLKEDEQGTEKSIFHGKSMYDYQGRTYLHVPGDVETNLHGEAGSQDCFVPKSCIHTWTGHTKGVSAIRLFPGSGHLLLSGSMDTKIKLWDVYHEGNCLRTFMGHSKAVRDIQFSNDGRRFLSAGYDRQIKLWDTETGQCLKAFSNGKVPYCIAFHPDEDKQNIFLTGQSDKKIVQRDINSGEVTQEYDQHLGPVNSITFVDENRRFVTTSDDKTMRAWDYDIPVVIKYVADPLMHSMPAVTVHPNKKWLACQSMDNTILIYSSDSLRQNRKKIFKGHTVAGYACQPAFSPDGRFLSSGDGEGNLVFWDWKSGRLLKRIPRAHKEVIISHAWLPHETSKVVTGSWDGTIKLWD